MQVEIADDEAQIIVNLIARGCSHLGQELAQRGLDAAIESSKILAVAHNFTLNLAQEQKKPKRSKRTSEHS